MRSPGVRHLAAGGRLPADATAALRRGSVSANHPPHTRNPRCSLARPFRDHGRSFALRNPQRKLEASDGDIPFPATRHDPSIPIRSDTSSGSCTTTKTDSLANCLLEDHREKGPNRGRPSLSILAEPQAVRKHVPQNRKRITFRIVAAGGPNPQGAKAGDCPNFCAEGHENGTAPFRQPTARYCPRASCFRRAR